MNLVMPFTLSDLKGEVLASVLANEDPKKWGFDLLGSEPNAFPAIKEFPVCATTVTYDGEGYGAFLAGSRC